MSFKMFYTNFNTFQTRFRTIIIYTTIIASGSYIPENVVKNDDFLNNKFFDPKDGNVFDKPNKEIIEKFYEITNIGERRWAADDQMTSDLGYLAAKERR